MIWGDGVKMADEIFEVVKEVTEGSPDVYRELAAARFVKIFRREGCGDLERSRHHEIREAAKEG